MGDFNNLISTIQKNCDLVDALHAQDYGLCIYLLKMRDYYRWRNNIPLTADLVNDDIHEWIRETEDYWDEIQGQAFGNLEINGNEFDVFDTDEINNELKKENLVYSGGLSYGAVPLFYLANLEEVRQEKGFQILISSNEHARGLFGPPALYRDSTIFIRKEALSQFLWSRYDEWQFKKRENPLGRAMGYYDFENDPISALEKMTKRELDTVIQHEIGEGLIGQKLGGVWQDMVVEFVHSKTEILLRAVRDLAVDCLTTLPFLLNEKKEASMHLYFSGFSDMRRELFPGLYLAYGHWSKTGEPEKMEELVSNGQGLWFDLSKEIISLYSSGGKNVQSKIDSLIEGVGNLSIN